MTDDPLKNASWRCSAFHELSLRELHGIYAARQTVFVVEQECVYLDVDGMDPQAWHLAAWADGAQGPQDSPLAYARLFPPGVKYPEASIGRVLTTAPARGRGWGRALVSRAVRECDRLFGRPALRISAQAHLDGFYEGFGFGRVGEPYLEDGIPHIEMRRPAGQA